MCKEINEDGLLSYIRGLSDRDLKLFMKYLYQEGFQDHADSLHCDSERAICKIVGEFKKL